MNRRLDDLSYAFKPKAFEFLARLTEAGIGVMIINTTRTPEEQSALVASGHSWVAHSKHQDGDAIDICPFDTYLLEGPDKLKWDNGDPVWNRIGAIGESIGLRWGGRWTVKDMGHFELVR